jgi:hypothetical protein
VVHEKDNLRRGSRQGDCSRHEASESEQRPASFPALQIFEVAAHFIDSLAIRGSIAIKEEMRVSVMDALDSSRMPDRTPVLLRSRCNLHNVRQQPVGIRAVRAVQRLEDIQVSQFAPVNRHIVPAPRFRYAVNGKANRLVHRNEKVKQHKRNNTGVNKWRRQDHEESGTQQVTKERSL